MAPIFPPTIEDHPRRWLAYPLLAVVIGLLAVALGRLYQPNNWGVDQNGYMVTARMLTEHHRLYFTLHNPWQFAGRMMIQTPDGRIFAKYPPCMGVLAGLLRLLGGAKAMYLVDPICTVLACLVSFFLFRQALGNFMSLMGVIWLACNPVTLTYANDANSHGAALCFTVIGFWALLSWWRRGGSLRAAIAGLSLGFCTWIRYTEFLWILPLMVVLLMQCRTQRRPLHEYVLAIGGFCLPVGILAGIQWISFGAPWKTGYSFCKEQTGFSWHYFIGDPTGLPPRQGNWQTVMEQFSNLGLFLLFPLAIAGTVRLFFSHAKFALVLACWVVPSAVVYMFYYWAPTNVNATGYLRFFLDIFPALILIALWMLDQAMGRDRIITAITVGILTLLGAGYNLYTMSPRLLQAFGSKLTLSSITQCVQSTVPKGSVLFGDEQLCNYLNAIGGYHLYSVNLFDPDSFRFFQGEIDLPGPHGLQVARARAYRNLVGYKDAAGQWQPLPLYRLRLQEIKLVDAALAKGRKVVFVLRTRELRQYVPIEPKELTTRTIATIDEQGPGNSMHPLWMAWFKPTARLVRRWQRLQARKDLFNQWAIVQVSLTHPAAGKVQVPTAAAR